MRETRFPSRVLCPLCTCTLMSSPTNARIRTCAGGVRPRLEILLRGVPMCADAYYPHAPRCAWNSVLGACRLHVCIPRRVCVCPNPSLKKNRDASRRSDIKHANTHAQARYKWTIPACTTTPDVLTSPRAPLGWSKTSLLGSRTSAPSIPPARSSSLPPPPDPPPPRCPLQHARLPIQKRDLHSHFVCIVAPFVCFAAP